MMAVAYIILGGLKDMRDQQLKRKFSMPALGFLLVWF